MHWRWVDGWGDGDDAVEVVVLVEHHHDLQSSVDDADALVQVVRLHDQLLKIQGELKLNLNEG